MIVFSIANILLAIGVYNLTGEIARIEALREKPEFFVRVAEVKGSTLAENQTVVEFLLFNTGGHDAGIDNVTISFQTRDGVMEVEPFSIHREDAGDGDDLFLRSGDRAWFTTSPMPHAIEEARMLSVRPVWGVGATHRLS